jgi:hypothetical protein
MPVSSSRPAVTYLQQSEALHKVRTFLDMNYPCGCTLDPFCDGNAEEAGDLVDLVLKAIGVEPAQVAQPMLGSS